MPWTTSLRYAFDISCIRNTGKLHLYNSRLFVLCWHCSHAAKFAATQGVASWTAVADATALLLCVYDATAVQAMRQSFQQLGSAVQEGDEEEETDKLVQQVFAEIGISATEGMVSAPSAQHAQQQQEAAAQPAAEAVADGGGGGGGGGGGEAGGGGSSGVDEDLAARLEALRRG